ncbi:hypothetical protein D0Y50_11500 [Salinimonas sediminis]|uniref:Uncharacterized protein n=1 Tax=Salinimonas sediminis TaxID=2303538 RepID=A0A346NN16_9ALTE|nr:hypothetical protein D0Y50_11500 [Salinimonas sediminis]
MFNPSIIIGKLVTKKRPIHGPFLPSDKAGRLLLAGYCWQVKLLVWRTRSDNDKIGITLVN